jgi:hypothetical protein
MNIDHSSEVKMSQILNASLPTTAYASRLLISEKISLLSEVTLILVQHNGGFSLQRLLEGEKPCGREGKRPRPYTADLVKVCAFFLFLYT